ncbi:MAG TPA: hypothetical protein PLO39_06925, partial [Saprospiraceae bacterium]|nr:hypothetical protein [Saprospiraceae bacterium]
MSLEVTCLNRSIHDAQCDIEGGDTNVTSGINIYDNVNLTTRFLYSPVYATFGDTVAYLFDLRGNKISISYADLDGIDRSDLETLLEDCGCCGSGSDYLEVNNTPIGYIPTLSGNVTNLNEVVIDSVGTKWIIDVLGNATQLGTGANVKWTDKLVAFGHTLTGGLFYQSDF